MEGKSKPYDYRQVTRYLVIFLLMMIASNITRGLAILGFTFLMIFSVVKKKPEILLFIILATTCFIMTNGLIIKKGIIFIVCSKILMLSSSIILMPSMLGHRHSKYLTPLLTIFPYLIFITISSQFGWNPLISNLKIFLFTMIFIAYYACSLEIINITLQLEKIRSMLISIASLYIAGSVILVLFPSIGYMSYEDMIINPNAISLFKGMANHSQTLGPLVTIFGILLYADMIFSLQKIDYLYIILIFCCPILIYMSSSRTGMASFIAGMTFVSICAMNFSTIHGLWRKKIFLSVLGFIFIFALITIFSSSVRNRVAKFTIKYRSEETLSLTADNIWKSRERQLNESLINWRKSPYIGNGFQVSEGMSTMEIKDFRQILSAPVEKSTWTHAILEEGGVLGLVIFILFILLSISMEVRRKGYITSSLLFTFILSNMGEFTFFSMSADGGFFWLLIFIGAIMDHKGQEKNSIQDSNNQINNNSISKSILNSMA